MRVSLNKFNPFFNCVVWFWRGKVWNFQILNFELYETYILAKCPPRDRVQQGGDQDRGQLPGNTYF